MGQAALEESSTKMAYKHLDWVDNTRCLACVLVVMLHAAVPFITTTGQFDWLGMPAMIEAASRPAVPLFFMLTGFLLLSREREFGARDLGFRLTRVMVPLIFYSFVFMTFSAVMSLPVVNPLIQPTFYHLWFLYASAVVSMMLALFRPANFSPAIGAAVSFGLLLFCSGGFAVMFAPHAFMIISQAAVYIIYALAGFYLAQLSKSNWARIASLVAYLSSTFLISLLTQKTSEAYGILDQRFYQYDGMLVIVQSFAIFYLCRWSFIRNKKLCRCVALVAGASLGVYGLHPLFLHLALDHVPRSSLGMFLAMLIAFTLAAGGSALIRGIPKGKWVA